MPLFWEIVKWVVIVGVLVYLFFTCLNIVPQESAYVVERLGKYHTTWNAGIHLRIPFVDRIACRASLKEQVADFAPQPVITKDNVTMRIDSVVYFKVMNTHDYAYGVENPIMAMENLTATTLRNIIGDMELDATLTSREQINSIMLKTIDLATDPWGIKVTRVELKNIEPPAAIREAMEKQMRAERERRESILVAEGKKQAAILNAEGDKESLVLRATAEKEAQIAKAEGQAEALRLVYEAQAKAIQYINEANPESAYIQLEGLKALKNLADGQATKIIVPNDLAGLAGTLTTLSESLKDPKKPE